LQISIKKKSAGNKAPEEQPVSKASPEEHSAAAAEEGSLIRESVINSLWSVPQQPKRSQVQAPKETPEFVPAPEAMEAEKLRPSPVKDIPAPSRVRSTISRLAANPKIVFAIGGLLLVLLPAFNVSSSTSVQLPPAANPAPEYRPPVKYTPMNDGQHAEGLMGIEAFQEQGLKRPNPPIPLLEKFFCMGRRSSRGCSGHVYHPYIYWWENNLTREGVSADSRGIAFKTILKTFVKTGKTHRISKRMSIGNRLTADPHND